MKHNTGKTVHMAAPVSKQIVDYSSTTDAIDYFIVDHMIHISYIMELNNESVSGTA